MHFSISFERKQKLDTGLQFLWIRSRPTFLSMDLTMAAPCVWEMLTYCIIVLKHLGGSCFSKLVGIGSSLQDLVFMLNVSFLTSSSVRVANLLNNGAFHGLAVYFSVSSKSSLIAFILLRK